MKIVSFSDLHKTDFAVSAISAIRQVRAYRSMSVNKRVFNGFLLVEQGEARYDWEGGSAELKPYSLIYLPKDSVHRLTVHSDSISFYRISFSMTDMKDGERIIFSETPWLASEKVGSLFLQNTVALVKACSEFDGKFKAMSILCELLSDLKQGLNHTYRNRIIPAIEYIHSHYTEDTSARELADLCYISETHMYRLFKEVTGKTPVEYRNSLRIKMACLLLREEGAISEIAASLGFENVYYFSRVFKKYMGVSPTGYADSHR